MKFKLNHVAFASLAAMASALVAQPALAQSAPAQSAPAASADNPLGDIVVTARKVAESSQSLPITVAAFSGAELNKKVVLNAPDLQAITPGLTISNNTTGGVPIFAIRGVSTELGIDGGVALYFNDVPLISTVGIMANFFDLQAVEVLKGPQGTQFGTNTTGGTISVRTNTPTDKFEGYVKAGYGNFNRREFEGMVNLPVSDTLGFRFAGNYVKRDGYIKNPDNAGVMPDAFQDENHYALRGTMSFHSGPIKNDLIVDYYNRDEKPFGYVPVRFSTSLLGINLGTLGAQLGDYQTVHMGPSSTGVNTPMYGKAKLYGFEDRLNLEVSDNLALRNIFGYRNDHTTTSEEDSGTNIVTVGVYKDTRARQWTDDLTLRYTGLDGKLRASLGGYISFLRQEIGFNANVLQGLAPVLYAAFVGTPVPADLSKYVIATSNFEKRENQSRAIYFNAEYDITDTLGINGGFRYNWDNVTSNVTAGGAVAPPGQFGVLPNWDGVTVPEPARPCAPSNLAGYPNFNPTNCTASRTSESKAPSWNIVLTNKFSSRLLTYIKASHGYLAGGTNFTLRDPGRTTYAPETTTMFEAGVKADWELAGRPIRTNVAVYYGKTNNKQVFANANYIGGGTGFGVVNAAKESVYGIDLEARYSPVEGLTFDLGYNYIHAKFDQFIYPALGSGAGAVPATDLSGATPAQTPAHQLNVAGTYVWPTSADTGKISTTVSGYYTSAISQSNRVGTFDAAVGGDLNKIPGYFILNASAGWDNVLKSPVNLQLWVRNLTNKHYQSGASIQFATFGYATAIYNPPRTFGASATVKF